MCLRLAVVLLNDEQDRHQEADMLLEGGEDLLIVRPFQGFSLPHSLPMSMCVSLSLPPSLSLSPSLPFLLS